MRRVLPVLIILVSALVFLMPTAAHAEGYVSPFLGVNFANNSGDGRVNFGFDAGWMGAGIAGVEFDLGYAPNFFGSEGRFGENHVLTGMANLIVGVPTGRLHGAGVRPYGTLGVGLVRTQVTGTAGPSGVGKIDDNSVGLNAGVGVMGFFSRHGGVRGDVRYFRNFREESATNTVQFGSFHFWRASLGVILR